MAGSAPNDAGSIVVGVDGSPLGEHAVIWAAEEARLQHRGLTLVHAQKSLSGNELAWFRSAGVPPEGITDRAVQEAEHVLERARGLATDRLVDTGVETLLYHGDARRVLLELSDSASLVVVGSRGHGRVVGLLLGSVSVALLSHAHTPVALVRPTGEGRGGVLVGADGSEASREPLEHAYGEASARGLPLTVVHCLWRTTVGEARWRQVDSGDPELEEARLHMAESLAGMAEKYPDVPVHVSITRGAIDACLVDLSRRYDLLVLGRAPRSLGERLILPGLTISVAEHAHTPVLVVP